MNSITRNFWINKKVLITGHTGFKGSWLCLILLQLGAEITGFSLEPNEENKLFNKLFSEELKDKSKFTSLYGNIQDHDEFTNLVENFQPEIIIHLAAQAFVFKGYLEPLETWKTNVLGSLNILEALKNNSEKSAVVMVTTDKVYKNNNLIYSYRENDVLGGNDPYSASKAAMELAVNSWRESFCKHGKYKKQIKIATARAGNVIGGGDWAENRIVPDAIRSHINKRKLSVRNTNATRPWQHVMEPLIGYLMLAEKLYKDESEDSKFSSAFNFGPNISSCRRVDELVDEIFTNIPGDWTDCYDPNNFKESINLSISSEKSQQMLLWKPILDFKQTIKITVEWYKKYLSGNRAFDCCMHDIDHLLNLANNNLRH